MIISNLYIYNIYIKSIRELKKIKFFVKFRKVQMFFSQKRSVPILLTFENKIIELLISNEPLILPYSTH